MHTITLSAQSLDFLQAHFPPRPSNAHKGDFGHVLVIGGNYGMGGAVCLSAIAAARVGAGLVSVATRALHVPAVIAARPELMCHGVDTVADIQPLLARASVILVGPGLGRDAWAEEIYAAVMASPLPKVIDADGLYFLSSQKIRSQESWILTPHPGEAAQLLGCKTAAIQADRSAAAMQLQAQYGGVIVLKGMGSIVQAANARYLCTAGNPGMASGGMGDVLGGMIAGLLAQGFTSELAAALSTLVHALAADEAALEGERGLLAMDLMPYVRKWVNYARL